MHRLFSFPSKNRKLLILGDLIRDRVLESHEGVVGVLGEFGVVAPEESVAGSGLSLTRGSACCRTSTEEFARATVV